MTRNGVAIFDHPIKRGVSSGIQYSMYYEGVTAAIAAGATLDEIHKWIDGGYPSEFMATIIAWHRTKKMVDGHTEDAVAAKSSRK